MNGEKVCRQREEGGGQERRTGHANQVGIVERKATGPHRRYGKCTQKTGLAKIGYIRQPVLVHVLRGREDALLDGMLPTPRHLDCLPMRSSIMEEHAKANLYALTLLSPHQLSCLELCP